MVTPVTIKTNSIQKLLFLTSQGEIEGFPTSDVRKHIYVGNTPIQNADNTFNINNTEVAVRNGTVGQPVIGGFPLASTAYNIATKVTTSSPVVYTTTTSNVDRIRVTVRIPALFEQKDNGEQVGTTVQFRFRTRLGAGSYSTVRDVTINEFSPSTFDLDYVIPRPLGTTGVWSVELSRITADNSSLTKANDIFFQVATEIQDVSLTYDKNALVALTLTSENTGQQLPIISFDLKGVKVRVPSNYTVSTRAYSGDWDGTFKVAKEWCDNPVFFLLELMTNTDWGLGNFISDTDIDLYAFYDAAQYCDELVPALDATGQQAGTEPRFTFNHQFTENADPWQVIQNVAAAMQAVVYQAGSLISIYQERPVTVTSRIITNSNVIDGAFEYSSTPLASRYTAAIVYWNDPNQNGLSIPEYYEDTAAIARYGYSLKEVTALGCWSWGQARRYAKMVVESSISNTELVNFTVGFKNATIEIGEKIEIADSDYAQIINEATVVTSTASTITLDRPITVASGNTFTVVAGDGVSLETRTITSTGTLTTIGYSGAAITAVAGADFILSAVVQPRPFIVQEVREERPGIYSVAARLYDANKFARIDDTPEGPAPVYQLQPDGFVVGPVSTILFEEESLLTPEGAPRRYLTARWSPPSNQLVLNYQVYASIDDGPLLDLGLVSQPFVREEVIASGTYKVIVYARNVYGKQSAPTTGTYVVDMDAPVAASGLSNVTGLQVQGGGVSFTGTTCVVEWTNPNVNNEGPVQKGYQVTVKSADGVTTYRTEELPPDALTYTYDLVKQEEDNPGARKRTFRVNVKVIDTFNRLTSGTEITVENAAPAVPANISVTALPGGLRLDYDAVNDPDLVGYILWYSTSSGFTPASTNRYLLGNTESTTFAGLSNSTTYYYRVAAYDAFASQTDIDTGSNLNVSAQLSTATQPGVSSGFVYRVTAPGAVFQPTDGGAFSPSTLTVSASLTVGSGSPSAYAGRFIIASSTDGSSWTDRYTSASDESATVWTITPTSANFFRVRLYLAGGTTTLLDEEVLPVINNGAVGANGEAAITVIVRNDKHTFPADSAGTVSSYAGSGVIINVYEGSQQLIYNSSLGVGDPGKFTVGTPTVVNGTVTVPSPSYSGLGTVDATTGNLSAMTTDTATIRWPITVWRNGKPVGTYDPGIYYATQTVGKAKQGATGGTGNTGDSQRTAYALFTGSPGTVTWDSGATRTVSGDNLPGNTTVSNPDSATSWTATPQTVSAGQTQWVSFGRYRVATNDTAWDAPILATLRVAQLSAIVADLGTITAGSITSTANIDINGFARFKGNDSISVLYFGSSITRTAAVSANTSLNAQVGVYGQATTTSGFGLMGVNTTGFSGGSYGIGVYGEGGIGVQGYALNTSSIGVFGSMSSSATSATAGYFSHNTNTNTGVVGVAIDTNSQTQKALTTQGGRIEFNGDNSNMEMRLKTATRGGTGNYGLVHALSTTTYRIGNTSSGSAESSSTTTAIEVTLSTSNVAVRGLSLSNMTVGTGAATSTFPGNNKPGSNSSNTWLTLVVNGTTYYVPIWT